MEILVSRYQRKAFFVAVLIVGDEQTAEDEMLGGLFKLSPRPHTVIVQRCYLGLSGKEMSEEIELAPATIKWLLIAARLRLRALFRAKRSVE